jgi:cohesin complex subunit SA-1/2
MSAAVAALQVDEGASSAARRRSGRVTRKPDSAKRKRGDNADSGAEDNEASSDEQSESSEGEPDEEELRERKKKRKGKTAAKSRATKKPKTNGATVSLAMRPATTSRKLAKRPRKAAIRKSAIAAEEPEGLYGMHI